MCVEDNKKLLVFHKYLVRNSFLKIALKKRPSQWSNPLNRLFQEGY